MTQPDEPTIPDRPEKAHGDALEEMVEASPPAETGAAEEPSED
jgi:hypothetical protein